MSDKGSEQQLNRQPTNKKQTQRKKAGQASERCRPAFSYIYGVNQGIYISNVPSGQ
ncbi:hypothetical protein J21TS7_41600 [Paenibacillus cineris]|uniref:Uncharacterized protein n=1 Tax=Paenibacillus cineris TaxID=237530 RepID=A0ABQ4LH81_9BACL|nr:hypothetical protein J21TS7_41600 [Paenibacillus cineris]